MNYKDIGSIRDLIEVLSRCFRQGTQVNYEEIGPEFNWTKYLLNTNPKRYHFINLLGRWASCGAFLWTRWRTSGIHKRRLISWQHERISKRFCPMHQRNIPTFPFISNFICPSSAASVVPSVQSAGWLDTDFSVSKFLRKRCVTCREKCRRAPELLAHIVYFFR
jgi:hypothetical protein